MTRSPMTLAKYTLPPYPRALIIVQLITAASEVGTLSRRIKIEGYYHNALISWKRLLFKQSNSSTQDLMLE